MIFEDWGLIDYKTALEKQLEYVDRVAESSSHEGYLIFCTHPAVVTTGRQTKADDIFAWKGPVIEISRGGRATYHGPSQVVVYPIFSLKNSRKDRGPQEVRGYLRALEKAIVETLQTYGIQAVGKTPQKLPNEMAESDETGVWVGPQKVASLGIAVKKWVTFHGAAINFDYDPEAFIGLNPCGFKSNIMTSLEQLTNKKNDLSQFKTILKQQCLKHI